MKRMQVWMLAALSTVIVLGSCKKTSSPNNENEHEAITTVNMVFKQNGNTVFTYVFDDPDGDGGNPPARKDVIALGTNQTYDVELTLLNKTKNPVSDVTPTIRNQATSHEMFYLFTGITPTVQKLDTDANGFPLGLRTRWITTTAGNGTMRLKLMHKPLIKGPTDSPDKGHSDIDVSFDVRVN
jgi:hypothetical protein